MRISLRKMSPEQIVNMPAWLLDKSINSTVNHKFQKIIYEIVCSYNELDRKNAIDNYKKNVKENPDWEKVFEEKYITDELLKMRYKKDPSEIAEKSLSYREVINAMLYKAFLENRGKRAEIASHLFKKEKKQVIKEVISTSQNL